MLDAILTIALWVVVGIESFFLLVPLGNEQSTVRRLPWVTFSIMAINALVFFGTLPATAQQNSDWSKARSQVDVFVRDHPEIETDPEVRHKLLEAGVLSQGDAEKIETGLSSDPDLARDYELWLQGSDATRWRTELYRELDDLNTATQASIWYRYGFAPNGNWQVHQLVTSAFLHGGLLHLFFNMVFFFAVAFSLEDLWGRSTFSIFYLLAAAASLIPEIIHPGALPSIGASGAISATMGAFLFRFHKSKIKILWASIPLALPLLAMGRKPFGTINVPAFIFLPFWFVGQMLLWWWTHKFGIIAGVGYSVHTAGFIFGLAFAGFISLTGLERSRFHPTIEAKVSFAASPEVTQSLDLLDKGEIGMAERKLKARLAAQPGDLNTILALIQVYQHTLNYTQLNYTYGLLIHHHLSGEDREAALYAYDGLLSCFPDNSVAVHIPVRDWLVICEYLHEIDMNREAAVEYERLVAAYPNDPMTIRACVQGGEAALAAHDNDRALRLFSMAMSLNPPSTYFVRAESGMDKCKTRLGNQPTWVKPSGPEPGPTRDLTQGIGRRNAS